MSSRSKWEEMTAYPGELMSAVKQARSDITKREASVKAKQYERESEERMASKKESPAAKSDRSTAEENRFSLEKIKARNKMMSEL